jgi:hypothetical protein
MPARTCHRRPPPKAGTLIARRFSSIGDTGEIARMRREIGLAVLAATAVVAIALAVPSGQLQLDGI